MFRSLRCRNSSRTGLRLACAAAIGLATPAAIPMAVAQAAEPTRQTITEVLHTAAPCPSGVVLQGLFDVTRDVTTYYDQDGLAIRRLQINSAEGTWTNPLTGDWLASSAVRQIHTDLITGETFSTGSDARTFLPGGGGVAIGRAGLTLFDATGHFIDHFGPDSATERAQLCAALGA